MSGNMDLLKVRVDMVESLFFGNKNSSPDLVQPRLQAIDGKLQSMEKEIPAVKACSEAILKLHPLINEKKLQINQINDKVDSLLARKDELNRFISDLEAIRQHSGVLGSDFCQNIGLY